MDRRGLRVSRSSGWVSRTTTCSRPSTVGFKSVVPRTYAYSDGTVEDPDFCAKGLAAWHASSGTSSLPAPQRITTSSKVAEDAKSKPRHDVKSAVPNACYKWEQQNHAGQSKTLQKSVARGSSTRLSSTALEKKCVGVSRFWSFVAEALKGSASHDPICRCFRLDKLPKNASDGSCAAGKVHAGVQLALGNILLKTNDDGVTIVRTTQRWALAKVRGLAESIKSYRRLSEEGSQSHHKLKMLYLSVQEVRTLLCAFPPYLRLLAKFGSTPVPTEQWPEGWKLHDASCEKQLAGSEGKDKSKTRSDQKERALHGTPGEDGQSRAQTSFNWLWHGCDDPCPSKVAEYAGAKRQDLSGSRVPKAKGRPKRPAGDIGKALSKKAKHSHGCDTKAVPRAKSQAKVPAAAINVATARTSANVAESVAGKVIKRPSGAVQAAGKRCCKICGSGSPELKVTKSCSSCTTTLSAQRNLNFSLEMRVWCRGFGPMWPARINAIGFASAEDQEPYRVRFYGDGRFAWVGESKLIPWESRRPASSVPPRWRKSMTKALKEVEEEKNDRADTAQENKELQF